MTPSTQPPVEIDRTRALRRLWLGRIRLSRAGIVAPTVTLGVITLIAVAAPWIAPYDPVGVDLTVALQPPAWLDGGDMSHLLGTDALGRDVFSRLLFGARISGLVALLSLTIGVCLGTAVGLFAGFVGGKGDMVLMRLIDIGLSLPTLLVGLVVAAAVGPSFRNLVIILGLLTWPRIARLVRGDVLVVKRQEFVTYAQASGIPMGRILRRHLLPNVLPSVLVAATLEVALLILSEASLSFLGAGVPPPAASWGIMISDGRALINSGWWIALFPGICITIVILSLNSFGDALRIMLDPKAREA